MEPGRKGREYHPKVKERPSGLHASMEPGRKGREYTAPSMHTIPPRRRLNGARPQRPGIPRKSVMVAPS